MGGIIDDKRGIFNRLSVFTSLKEIELKGVNNFDSISSINNDKDPIPFLLDLSTTLVGGDGLEEKLGQLFTNFIDKYNESSKDILKSNFVNFKSEKALSNDFISNGINIPVKSLDDLNNLKTEKQTPLGQLLYDNNTDNLLTKLKDSIIIPNSVISYNNLNIVYNEDNESINIKPKNNTTIGNFIDQNINGLSDINKKEFVTDILNIIFGLKSVLQNKTINELNKETEIDILINKINNEEEVLELTDEDIKSINQISEELIKGVNQIDFGCGIIDNVLTIEQLNDIANNVNTSKDPYFVGNQFVNIFNNTLNPNNDPSNKTKLKDSFIKKIINEIKNRLLKDLLFSPEKKLLFILFNYINDEDFDLSNLDNKVNYINNNKNIVNCVVKEIKSEITEFIFDLIKTEILEITKPALNKIITEKINNYRIILNSLISI